MHAIGFNLFMDMLDLAVNDLKSGKTPELFTPMHQGPEIDLRISAIIPDDYISDVHNRLIAYKRISNASTPEQVHDLQVELIDRFGLLPQPIKHLFQITELKLKAKRLGIQKISASGQLGKLEFEANPSIDPGALIHLIQVHAKRYKMEGAQRLRFALDAVNPQERIYEISALLDKLTSN
jgi:transcription-repair coupling factor (superfamily II helicase)